MNYLSFFKLLAVALVLSMVSLAAFAADATTYPIQVQSSAGGIIALLFAALTGTIGFASGLLKKKLKLSPESSIYLDHAITAALLYAQSKAQAAASDIKNPEVKSKVVAEAANFVLTSIPTLLASLGITPGSLNLMVANKLATSTAVAGTAPTSA